MADNEQIQVSDALAATAADCLTRVREQRPKVHCITNEVAANYTANSLLAIGAVPSMTTNPVEMEEFVSSADALLINLGTLGAVRIDAINAAVGVALKNSIRWCLDPVFVERSSTRLRFAESLVALTPDVIRANAAELKALNLLQANRDVAGNSCIAQTGAQDVVRRQPRTATVSNGHPMMATVTATGCALSALITAFVAVSDDVFGATVGAICALGVCGELAAVNSNGPGSFQNELLDQLYRLDRQTILARALIQ